MKRFSSTSAAHLPKMGARLCLALLAGAISSAAHAQPRNGQAQNGGVLDLPRGVGNLVSIDAHNILLAETDEIETGQPKEFVLIVPRHIYSGGLARLFGGIVIPAGQFVSPAFNDNSNGAAPRGGTRNRNNQSGGFGQNSSLQSGGQNFGGQSFGNFQSSPHLNLRQLQRASSLLDRSLPQVQIGR